jgi:hypothetical protein
MPLRAPIKYTGKCNRAGWSSGSSRLVFRRCWVRISAGTPNILTDISLFQSVSRQIPKEYPDSATVSFQIPSDSSFIGHPIIRSYIVTIFTASLSKQLKEREV